MARGENVRFFLGAVALASTLILTVMEAVAEPSGDIIEYPVPTPGAFLVGITPAPDGNVWFAEQLSGKIGRITPAGIITEFPVPGDGDPAYMTVGPDGNIWFTQPNRSRLGRITLDGVITNYPASGFPVGIAAGPDGNLWYVEQDALNVTRRTLSGEVTRFPVSGSPFAITAGPDGNLWFTEQFPDHVGRITPTGQLVEFPVAEGAFPAGITTGPDGNLWFTERFDHMLGRITPSGEIDETFVGGGPYGITVGSDGALWFAKEVSGEIVRRSMDGQFTSFPIPTPNSFPDSIAYGPDANVWFTERKGNKIGVIEVDATPGIGLSPEMGPPLTQVTVSGRGFGAFEGVKLVFVDRQTGTTTSVGSARASIVGQFSREVAIPADASRGGSKITAKGMKTLLRAQAAFFVT